MPRPSMGHSLLDRVARPLGLFDPEEIKSAMLEVARDAFVVLDEQLRVIEWSGSAPAVLGWHRDEVVGLSFVEMLTPPGERWNQESRLRRLLSRDYLGHTEHRIATAVLTREGMVTVEQSLGTARVRRKLILVMSMRPI